MRISSIHIPQIFPISLLKAVLLFVGVSDEIVAWMKIVSFVDNQEKGFEINSQESRTCKFYQHFSGTKPIICPIDPFNLLSIVILSAGGLRILVVRRGSAPRIPERKKGLLTSMVCVLNCETGQSSAHHIRIIFDNQSRDITSRR